MKRIVIAFAAGISIFGLAHAQISLPGAADSPPSDPSAKPEAHKKARKPAPIKATPIAPPSLKSIIDHPLFQNGVDGQLIFSLRDKILRIEKFTLSGEVISDAKQKCRIDIVSEGPIQVKSLGAPDGMDRYSAEIPACPLTFDVLDGAVVAPPQTTACVFQAADCQASPSGVWGPEAASLEKDAKAIEKSRSRADASIVEKFSLDKGARQARERVPCPRANRVCVAARRRVSRLRGRGSPRILRRSHDGGAGGATADARLGRYPLGERTRRTEHGSRIPASAPRNRGRAPSTDPRVSGVDLGFRLQHLSAIIHARFQVDMMRPPQLAGVFVFGVSRRGEGVGRASHAAARGRRLASGNGHRKLQQKRSGCGSTKPGVIGERRSYTQSRPDASPDRQFR